MKAVITAIAADYEVHMTCRVTFEIKTGGLLIDEVSPYILRKLMFLLGRNPDPSAEVAEEVLHALPFTFTDTVGNEADLEPASILRVFRPDANPRKDLPFFTGYIIETTGSVINPRRLSRRPKKP